ncbi:MAG: hypothetical protein U0736_07430 [Gemmataceae bacterium]
MYDAAVERLTAAGFRQRTMRQFVRGAAGPDDEYRCQEHGMVGLGAGRAELYHRPALTDAGGWWRNIRAEIADYQRRMTEGDTAVRHGFALDADERQRRYVIQSLLFRRAGHRGICRPLCR